MLEEGGSGPRGVVDQIPVPRQRARMDGLDGYTTRDDGEHGREAVLAVWRKLGFMDHEWDLYDFE